MIKFKKLIFVFISDSLLFLPAVLFCSAPLPVDEAFKISVERVDSRTIRAQWDISSGYHLYRDEMSILLKNSNGAILGAIVYPKGGRDHSNILGDYDVYRTKLIVDIPVIQWGDSNSELIFKYQGCKDSSVCYPPVSKIFSISPPSTSGNNLSAPTLSSAQKLLEKGNILIALVSFFVFGVFLSLTPCVLPMIPILAAIIMGQKDVKTFKSFMLSLCYVFGVAVTYTIAGIFTAMLGNSIQSILQNFWIILSCSLIFVLLSLSLFGLYELRLPSSIMNKLNNVSIKTKGGTYIGVFLMGVISSLIVSPCVSAPLAGALIYIASTGNIFLGGSALFSLSLGMGVLLVITGVTGGKLFLKTGSWMTEVRCFLGVLMLGVAIWLLSRVVTQFVTDILCAVLMIGVGLYMGVFAHMKDGGGWVKFRKFIAILVMLFGTAALLSLFLTGHMVPTSDITDGRAISKTLSQKTAKTDIFNIVTTPEELQKFIAQAIKEDKPVMIDYYADWCTSCKEMDGATFANPDVRQVLKSFIAVRADITKNDASSTALKKKYNVFLPPYIVFLDNRGNEINQSAIAGYVAPDELLKQLEKISSKSRTY